MRITAIQMKNFMPFGGEHTVNMPKHEGRSLVIVWGRNEHGKTTLLNAVRWALYGYAVGRHRRRYEWAKMVNRDSADAGDWTMEVSLDFEHGGRQYKLVRRLARRELVTVPKSNADFSRSFMMTEDGSPLPADRAEQLIGRIMPEEVSRFHLFDGELLQEYEELVGAETTQVREIRKAIEDILGTPALLLGRDEVQELLKGARKRQAEAVKKADASNDAAEQLIATQAKIEAAHDDRVKLEADIADAEQEIEEIEEFLQEKAEELSRKDDIDVLEERLAQLKHQVTGLREEKAARLQTLWRDLLAGCVSDRVNDLQQSVRSREQRFRELGALEEQRRCVVELAERGVCPSCESHEGRRADPERLAKLELQIAGLEGSLSERDSALSRLATLASIQPTGDREAIVRLERALAGATVHMQRTIGDLEDLKKSVAEDAGREAQEKRRRSSDLSKWVGTLQQRRNQVLERIDELSALEDELSKIMSRSSTSEARRANLIAEVLTELHDLFKGAIGEHRDRLLKEVGSEASKRFLALTGTDGYRGLTINDNYGLSIIDQQGRIVDIRSSGAEQIVALSLIQALGRLSSVDAPLIVDTPFGRLDPEHRKRILVQLPDFGKQVVLLAHEGELDRRMVADVVGHTVAGELLILRTTPTQSKIAGRTD